MSIGLSYIDATYVEVEHQRNSFLCAKFSMPIYLKGETADRSIIMSLFDGTSWVDGDFLKAFELNDNHIRELPRAAFEARFTPLHNGVRKEHNIYGIKHAELRAIKMTVAFGVNVLDDQDFEYKVGSAGDYLVCKKTGINDVVKKEHFEKCYCTGNLQLQQIACPELVQIAIKKAQERFMARSEVFSVTGKGLM